MRTEKTGLRPEKKIMFALVCLAAVPPWLEWELLAGRAYISLSSAPAPTSLARRFLSPH